MNYLMFSRTEKFSKSSYRAPYLQHTLFCRAQNTVHETLCQAIVQLEKLLKSNAQSKTFRLKSNSLL